MCGLEFDPEGTGSAMVDESTRMVDGVDCDAVGTSPSRLWDAQSSIEDMVDVDGERDVALVEPDTGGSGQDRNRRAGKGRSRCRNNLASLGCNVVP